MKQRQNSKIKFTAFAAFIAIAGISGFFIVRDNTHVAANNNESSDANTIGQTNSPFSFNADATNGWYKGPASEKDLTLFGKRTIDEVTGKKSTDTSFAIIDYRDDGMSETDWMQQRADYTKYNPEYTLVPGEVITVTLNTSNGPIQYQLHTYRNQLKEGKDKPAYALNEAEAHGYIPYGNGYLRIQGYATPASLLPEVIDAIKSYSLDVSKQTF